MAKAKVLSINKEGVTSKKLGEYLNVSYSRVYQLVRSGVLPEPVNGRFDPLKCNHAYIAHLKALAENKGDLSLQKERARLTKNQADSAEIDLAKARGDAISLEDTAKLWSEMVEAFRARVLAIGPKVAPLLDGLEVHERRDVVDTEVHEALTELSKYGGSSKKTKVRDTTGRAKGGKGKAPANRRNGKAATKANRKPVGRKR